MAGTGGKKKGDRFIFCLVRSYAFSDECQKINLSPFFAKNKAVVAFFPVTDLDRWAKTTQAPGIKDAYVPRVCEKDLGLKAKSPIHTACAISAPTLLIHGEADTRVPMDQSLEMAKKMLDCGNRCRRPKPRSQIP